MTKGPGAQVHCKWLLEATPRRWQVESDARGSMAYLADGDGKKVSVDLGIEVQDLQHLLLGFWQGGKGGVALLPQELAGADEGRRVLELPAHHIRPLVQPQRQVSVAPNPLPQSIISFSCPVIVIALLCPLQLHALLPCLEDGCSDPGGTIQH